LVFALRANRPPPRPEVFVSLPAWALRGRGANAMRWPPFLDVSGKPDGSAQAGAGGARGGAAAGWFGVRQIRQAGMTFVSGEVSCRGDAKKGTWGGERRVVRSSVAGSGVGQGSCGLGASAIGCWW
jgi:hypothetical protein